MIVGRMHESTLTELKVKTMTTRTINGIQYEVYTDKDWCKDRNLSVEVGQLIEPSVYYQLLNALPPKRNDDLFQCGEPYSHDWNTGLPLFKTFERMDDNYYKYIGLMH